MILLAGSELKPDMSQPRTEQDDAIKIRYIKIRVIIV